MRKLTFILSSGLLMGGTAVAFAQGAADPNVLDTITQSFQTSAQSWEAPLQNIALGTFTTLAMIQFAWAIIRIALKQADFSEVCATIVQQIMYLGLFYWMLTTWTTWGPLIITSFRMAAGMAGGMTVMSPGDVFHTGIDMATAVWAYTMTWTGLIHVGQSAALGFSAFIILCSMTWICATMIIALVQGYFLAGTAVLFMAFGGNAFTREIALAGVRQVFAVGAKLFALQLVVTVGIGMIRSWVPVAQTFDVNQVMIMMGEALVLAAVAKAVPDMFERMLGGVGFAHGGAIFGAAAGAVATLATATSVGARLASGIVGAGAVIGGAADLAASQVAARSIAGKAPRSKTAALIGATAKNTGQAMASNIGAKLSGQRQRFGQGLYREAQQLNRQAQVQWQQNKDNTPVTPPPSNQNGPNNAP